MKELEFLSIIQNSIDNNKLLGDDCAYLEDMDIFITQDTLVEDVHFSTSFTDSYFLGRKSVNVNLSDLAAAMAIPKYVSISVSLPDNIKSRFISELYRGINDVCREYNVTVTGGDITGSDKIVISICAIGKKVCKYISSRSKAKQGDYILTTGNFGTSSIGLYALSNFLYADDEIIQAHINPKAKIEEANAISAVIDEDIAAMDTSDGLVDALFKISKASKHTLEVDFKNIPISQKVIDFAKQNNIDYKNFVKWGGEDYELILCVNENTYNQIDKNIFTCIGRVLNKDTSPCVLIKDGNSTEKITKEVFEKNSYNHFEAE